MQYLKVISILFVFLTGYGLSEYVSQRSFIAHKIDDYQREILISLRLLKMDAKSCNRNTQHNFSAYVEHAATAYETLLKKAEIFPYYLSENLIDDHKNIVSQYFEEIKLNREFAQNCDNS